MAGNPHACPECFSGNQYRYKQRPIIKCADCGVQYTGLWWTPFYRHKIPVSSLIAIAEMRIVHQMPMLQIAKRMQVDYKTVWSFCRKLAPYLDGLRSHD
jgi:ribosomal protein L37AE/L43A